MKKRLLKTVLVFAAAGILLTAFFVVGGVFPSFVVCPVRRFLHLSCPGCGMTSAIKSLLKLDFVSAFRHNLMFLPILGYIAFVFLQYITKYIKDGTKDLFPKPEWVNVAFLVLIIAWTVVRNILHI